MVAVRTVIHGLPAVGLGTLVGLVAYAGGLHVLGVDPRDRLVLGNSRRAIAPSWPTPFRVPSRTLNRRPRPRPSALAVEFGDERVQSVGIVGAGQTLLRRHILLRRRPVSHKPDPSSPRPSGGRSSASRRRCWRRSRPSAEWSSRKNPVRSPALVLGLVGGVQRPDAPPLADDRTLRDGGEHRGALLDGLLDFPVQSFVVVGVLHGDAGRPRTASRSCGTMMSPSSGSRQRLRTGPRSSYSTETMTPRVGRISTSRSAIAATSPAQAPAALTTYCGSTTSSTDPPTRAALTRPPSTVRSCSGACGWIAAPWSRASAAFAATSREG